MVREYYTGNIFIFLLATIQSNIARETGIIYFENLTEFNSSNYPDSPHSFFYARHVTFKKNTCAQGDTSSGCFFYCDEASASVGYCSMVFDVNGEMCEQVYSRYGAGRKKKELN